MSMSSQASSPLMRWWSTRLTTRPRLLYGPLYATFVVLSTLDLVLTGLILQMGGQEVNLIANAVLQYGGLSHLAIYKYALVTVVIVMCEHVGRIRPITGRLLSETAIALTSVPVIVAAVQVFAHV